jgi:hypothetical protein
LGALWSKNMPKKKILDYKQIKPARKKQLTANIGTLAKKAGVKPSDFKNRKAYLNYISRKAGFNSYYDWQKARRAAGIPAGSGGRKKQVKNIYELKVNLSNYKTDFYKWEQYFEKVNKGRESELKYFELITEEFRTASYISSDIEVLFNWLASKIQGSFGYRNIQGKKEARIILHFQELNLNEEPFEKLENPEDIF